MAKKKADKPEGGAAAPSLTIRSTHKLDIAALSFLPGGRFLLSGSFDATIKVWGIASGAELGSRQVGPSKWGVVALAVSADGYTAAAISQAARGSEEEYPQPFIFNLVGQGERRFDSHHRKAPGRYAVSAAASACLVALGGHSIRLFAAEPMDYGPEGEPIPDSACESLAFSPDGGLLYAGDEGGQVRAWNVVSRESRDFGPLLSGPVSALACSPCGRRLAIGGRGEIRICGTADMAVSRRFDGPWEDVDGLAFLPGNGGLVSFHRDDQELRLWPPAGQRAAVWTPREYQRLTGFAVSPVPPSTGRVALAFESVGTYPIQVWEAARLWEA